MDWSRYLYIAPLGALSCAFVYLVARRSNKLVESGPHTLFETGTLLGVLGLGIAIIYWPFVFGGLRWAYLDLGLDTFNQYVPFYINLLDAVRTGRFVPWFFEFGLGTTAISCQSWILDPFNLVTVPLCLAFGDSFLGQALVIAQALKIILTGLLCDRLMGFFCETPLARILGSTLYALGGWLLLWGQHYWLGTSVVFFSALLLLLEQQLTCPSRWHSLGLSLVTGIALSWSVYVGFMCLLGAAMFALLRIVSTCWGQGPREWVRAFARLVAPVIAGCAIAGFALVPYARYLLGETGRVTSGTGEQSSLIGRVVSALGGFVPRSWIMPTLSRLLGSGLISCGAALPYDLMPPTDVFPYVNVFEIVMLGCSAAVIVLLLQFADWVWKDCPHHTQVLVLAGALLVTAYCTNNFLPALFNALAAPKYRSSFVIALPICIACAVGWEQRVMNLRLSRPLLAVGGVGTLGIECWSLVHTVNGRLVCLYYLATTTVLLVCLFIITKKKERRLGALLVSACALIISSSIVDGFFVTNNRTACTTDTFPTLQKGSLIENTSQALAYLREYDTDWYRIEKLYTDRMDYNESLIEHYQGIAAYNSTIDHDVVDFYHELWPEAVPIGTFYQQFLSDPNEPELLGMLGVKYLLSTSPLDWSWCEQLAQFGDVNLYRCTQTEAPLRVQGSVWSESAAGELDIAERRSLLSQAIIVPDEVASSWTASKADSDAVVRISQTANGGFSGSVTCEHPGVACLALPHTAGWRITVDGIEVETFRANYGFIGFELADGTHTIEVSYTLVGLSQGAVCSIIGVALAVLVAVAITKWASPGSVGEHREPVLRATPAA